MAASEIFRRINPLDRGEISPGAGAGNWVLMSADHYDWLVAAAKRTHRAAETPDVVLSAIERAEMDPKHAPLDELLK